MTEVRLLNHKNENDIINDDKWIMTIMCSNKIR